MTEEKPDCFGEFLYESCRRTCKPEAENKCRLYTNSTKGECICSLKKYCHTSRQYIHHRYKADVEGTCDFKPMLEEQLKAKGANNGTQI